MKDVKSARTIIFIHGSGGISNTWKNQFDIKISCNIIAIDLPSHGKSDKIAELNLELYVDNVRELVIFLKIKEVILAGHSLGGAVIQEYYFKYPDDVLALLLIGTGGRLRVKPQIFDSLKKDHPAYLESLKGAFSESTDKSLIDAYSKESSKNSAEVTYSDFIICDNFDTLDKTTTIGIPCLIVCGIDDSLTPVKYSEYFHKKLKNSELVLIENAGHMA
ncbi:hypothetical protein LCGC14_1256540, partial [marine sediment metagenome]